jgi:hypothetical protein
MVTDYDAPFLGVFPFYSAVVVIFTLRQEFAGACRKNMGDAF